MSETVEWRDILAAPDTTLTRTIAAVEALEALKRETDASRGVRIGISSNVSIDLLGIYLRKHALLTGTVAEVVIGNHDDPIADIDRFGAESVDRMLFLPFFDNIGPGFERRLPLMGDAEIRAQEEDLRTRWHLVFDRARSMRQVFACTMHRVSIAVDDGRQDALDQLLHRWNVMLRDVASAYPNVRVVDTAPIIHQLGIGAAIDTRFHLRNTAPYTPAFLNELGRRIVQATRGFEGWFYKVLVVDCDNTLWGGVIGEDLLDGIRLDPYSYPGKVYWLVQQELLGLQRDGVLLCLCSKNNEEDILEVLDVHPNMVIRREHIAVSRINWEDKVGNLKAIAQALNVGLDSLVFIDDSSFECEAVRTALPMVHVVQVPSALPEYLHTLRGIRELFLAGGVSEESRRKTEQYRQRQAAESARADFSTHEEYLASLGIRVRLATNDTTSIARISELTQKSNQFNLTTLRLTPAEIADWMQAPDRTVYSLTVNDRFGDAGLTGVVLMRWDHAVARVEAFLMSCRVIGRGIEFAIWPALIREARRRDCTSLEAFYRATAKNRQVADFFDRLGIPVQSADQDARSYAIPLAEFTPPPSPWVEVHTL